MIATIDKNMPVSESAINDGWTVDDTKGATCCICGCNIPLVTSPAGYETTIGQNNPAPIVNDDDSVCCNGCNAMYVIPARMGGVYNNPGMLLALADKMRVNGCS